MTQTTTERTATATTPAHEYHGYFYLVTLQHDADGEPYPLYTFHGQTYLSRQQMQREIDHRINAAKLGRSDSESLI